MRLYARLTSYWPNLLALVLTLSALALLWRVRDAALELGAIGHIDALSAFFALALFSGSALAAHQGAARWWRTAAAVLVLALAYSTALIPMIVVCYLLFALLTLELGPATPASAIGRSGLPSRAASLLRRGTHATPGLLAAACLLVGYGALALRGAIRYDDRTAGAALDSFVFWFVLLAAIIPLAPLARTENREPPRGYPPAESTKNQEPRTGELNLQSPISNLPHLQSPISNLPLYRFAWLYPLARLYSLGPWNNGWSFATLMLGGALALWCAISALSDPHASERSRRISTLYLALALVGFGLGTSAGIAAGCFGILTYLVLVSASQESEESKDGEGQFSIFNFQFALSSALPFTAPFVAAWMLMGAAVAGGVALLAGVAWLAALLHALTFALWGVPGAAGGRRTRQIAGAISILLGVAAPLVVRWPIQPIAAQLQGGLTAYGDINIWPWVGLATSDSAHTQVTTLPSIAIALLMLVLSALVYLVARLREVSRSDRPLGADYGDEATTPALAGGVGTVLRSLRDEVPWLGGLLGSVPRDQRRPGDDE